MSELVLVLDFGGQYKELIARTIRELSVYSEIKPGYLSAGEIKKLNPIGIILTGGGDSAYLPESPRCDPELFNLGIPILGICYGMQIMCHMLGGEAAPGGDGEYGRVMVTPAEASSKLFNGINKPFMALMRHRDAVIRLPESFFAAASTAVCTAACENAVQKLYGVQFHPETKHTSGGREIIKNFLYGICGAAGDYRLNDYIATQIREIQQKVGEKKVLLALSGGVDSSVCASLLSRAVPGQLTCIFVDHGFMRLNEGEEIEEVFSKRQLRFIRVNAQERFLAKLKGVTEPETKRKLIGGEFVRVFEEEAATLGNIPFLAQGTIYPDIIESGGKYGNAIKSHHNVGGLPKDLGFTGLVEPLSGFFKDEVRVLGKKLGLPAFLVNRQPFPGPGLAVRVMGEVTREKLDVLRSADAILREELDRTKNRPDQYFAVMTNTLSVGIKGDNRTCDPVVAIRAIMTDDFMTCEYAPLPHRVLNRISSRIVSEIPAVSRVVYDITSKPPATVEWE
ncbi:MAG: glutamine-hydrolyzing GMP synthase [Treponema sp.]|nr:glutamine-hydrolyzing GMP synthase [Treponema sp.]